MIGTLAVLALCSGLAAPIATRSKNFIDDDLHVMEGIVSPTVSTTASVFPKHESMTNVTFIALSAKDHWDQIALIESEFDEYEALDDDWDGAGAIAPDPRRVAYAKAILSLVPGGIPFPKPMLGADGEVGLFWKTPKGFADIVVNESGKFSLYVRESGAHGNEVYVESIPVEAGARLALSRHLSAFARG